MKIPSETEQILTTLINNGYEAYCVGGCVRDDIINRKTNDFDICTSAKPEDIIRVFGTENTIPTGIKHGTVTVKNNGCLSEVTTFRIDGEYLDLRHPETVTFTSNIKDDLKRRDFTINAMAYNAQSGLLDFFGGQEDIKNKIIRCVGNPDERFTEDALRILRAIRFSAQLNFDIEEETIKAIHRNKDGLKYVSVERMMYELTKILISDRAEVVLKDYRDIFAVFIPEIEESFDFNQKSVYHNKDVYSHTLAAVGLAPKIPEIRMAAFLHDISKPESCVEVGDTRHFHGHAENGSEKALQILGRLRTSRKFREDVSFMILHHEDFGEPSRPYVLRMLSQYGPERCRMLYMLQKADAAAHAPGHIDERVNYSNQCLEILEDIMASGEVYNLHGLAIKGNDPIFKELNVDSKKIGEILNTLLCECFVGNLHNDPKTLRSMVKEIIDKKQ